MSKQWDILGVGVEMNENKEKSSDPKTKEHSTERIDIPSETETEDETGDAEVSGAAKEKITSEIESLEPEPDEKTTEERSQTGQLPDVTQDVPLRKKTVLIPRNLPHLRITSSQDKGKVVGLDVQRLTIGRSPDNKLFLDNDTVSNHHAEVVRKGLTWTVKDVGSTNGILVNGKQLKEKLLKSGDEIIIGEVVMIFESGLDGESVRSKKKPVIIALMAVIVVLMIAMMMKKTSKPQPVPSPTPTQTAKATQAPPLSPPGAEVPGSAIEAAKAAREVHDWQKVKDLMGNAVGDPSAQALMTTASYVIEHLELGKASVKDRRWQQAFDEFQKVVSIDPSWNELKTLAASADACRVAQGALEEGKASMSQMKWGDAIDSLKELSCAELSGEVNEIVERCRLEQANEAKCGGGASLLKQRKPSDAIKAFNGVAKGSLYAKKASEGIARSNEMIAAEGIYRQAQEAYRKGDGQQALQLLQSVAAKDPGHPNLEDLRSHIDAVCSAFGEGEKCEKSGDLTKAYGEYSSIEDKERDEQNEYLKKAKAGLGRISPPLIDKASAALARAKDCETKDDLVCAATQCKEALKIYPRHQEALEMSQKLNVRITAMARKLFEEGYVSESEDDIESAVLKWKKIISLAPEDHEYYVKAKEKLMKYGAY